mgnify:FL=1|jgi:hypothetical protein|tara:strand:- start:4112 stop:4414 length:303 start_codon:yes stop_codon:yes gene_type:complete
MAKHAIRKSARDEMCTLQIFPHCNNNTETTVLCHLNSSRKGMALKSLDYFAVYGCSDCHNVIDGRVKTNLTKEDLLQCQFRALERTWNILVEKGLITVNN